MRIDNLKKQTLGNKIRVSADFTYRSSKKKTVFFEVDNVFENIVSFDMTIFVPIAIMTSMKLGEDLVIDFPISKKFAEGLYKVKELLVRWDVGFINNLFSIGELTEENMNPTNIASFFSSGVDSFYTFLKNRDDQNIDRINHLILIHGFDVDLKDESKFASVLESVQSIANEERVKVISIRTNLRDLTDEILFWGFAGGAAQASTCLLLRKGMKKIYVPSSYTFDTLFPWGSHPDLDPLWSTESLEIVHDGCDTTRLDKTKFISKYPISLKYLRVCWKNVAGVCNCGSCPKCLRTMIDLKIAGSLEKSQTFKRELDLRLVMGADARSHGSRVYYEQSLKELERCNMYPELQRAIKFLLYEKNYTNLSRRIRDYIGGVDARYNKSRLYRLLARQGLV